MFLSGKKDNADVLERDVIYLGEIADSERGHIS